MLGGRGKVGEVRKMRIVCIQHVPFEDAGLIVPWAAAREHRFEVVRLYEGQGLPVVSALDWLVVMGGPMSVHDEERFPWLRKEKEIIAGTIDAGRVVLGICLGAQLIAEVLGARVLPAAHKEVGWHPVSRTQDTAKLRVLDMLPTVMTPFHWHGETFDIPEGTVHAFSSQACPNQAFVHDERVVALQFHLEMTPQGVRRLIENCPRDLQAGPFVQAAEAMTNDARAFESAHMAMSSLLDQLERLHTAKGGHRT